MQTYADLDPADTRRIFFENNHPDLACLDRLERLDGFMHLLEGTGEVSSKATAPTNGKFSPFGKGMSELLAQMRRDMGELRYHFEEYIRRRMDEQLEKEKKKPPRRRRKAAR